MPQTRLLAPDTEGIAAAADILRAGGRVALPTETVYGLGADARSDAAVAGIFAAKDRPAFNPLIVHVADPTMAEALVVFPDAGRALARAFWPGPMTLVLPMRPGAGIAPLVTAGLSTLGVRVPTHPVAHALLTAFGGPVAAPSANPSGRISPTTAAHVMAGLLGRIEAVLDGGASPVGLESTIVGFDTEGRARLLRPGGISAEEIEAVLGAPLLAHAAEDGITAPGQMLSHYAPSGTIRLNATAARPGETLVGFGTVTGALTLSAAGDLTEAAARLFAMFHQLDEMRAERIAIAPIPDEGLGVAINDRLRRAAAPRG
ncbi:L-threonylcarbamoyladenylate synthase [Pseudooceanicola sp. LIPI14-2-Ac024]|uniref:L-threonylcarbamoyladenylate synthase n=1 Tax=Pseudooceanicola sp. LIPI14-2-Ac024 TaxID=3344875 RepID=UPI0035D0B520